SSEDITGGMGFEGLVELQKFLRQGGVLVTLANAGTLAVEGGLVRDVRRVPPAGFNSPGSEVRARVLRPEHPIAYGYEERPSVFRGNGPIWDVDKRDRGRVVLQFGTKEPEAEEAAKKPGSEGAIEEEEIDDAEGGQPAAASGAAKVSDKAVEDKRLVLSGFVRGEDVVDGKPAILDLPVEQGRVILFAFNPLHRYLNLSDFRLVYNVLLNWNDLP
ncbi:MAG TPA: peptidase, partial [Thermoanaerobaculia bacterium]|nr:peptidase [Thermoanaerobaculia bacterium]